MNLININETHNAVGRTIKTVNARELHEGLDSRQEFANWIKNRIEKYGFIEGKDFLTTLSKSTGGRPSTEYHLTINMAKELSMVENNERGKLFRRYFIDCEERLQAHAPLSYREAVAELLSALDREEAQRIRAEEAERTKAAIQAGRQATLMQNEGVRQKKINKLEQENEVLKVKAQESDIWKAMVNVPWIKETFDLDDAGTRVRLGHYLKNLSGELEYGIEKIPGKQYDINAYHIDVIQEFHFRFTRSPRMLPLCERWKSNATR